MLKVLGIDLSTSCTGYAIFEDKKLVSYGAIKPQVPLLSKMTYPIGALKKCVSTAEQLMELVLNENPDRIVIEEINRGISRIGQKVLDGAHFILLHYLETCFDLRKVSYLDTDGRVGWRSRAKLNLIYSEKQKAFNKGVKAENHKIKRANKKRLRGQKLDLKKEITKKTLACEKANKLFGLALDDWKRKSDEDLADAILLTWAYIIFDIPSK